MGSSGTDVPCSHNSHFEKLALPATKSEKHVSTLVVLFAQNQSVRAVQRRGTHFMRHSYFLRFKKVPCASPFCLTSLHRYHQDFFVKSILLGSCLTRVRRNLRNAHAKPCSNLYLFSRAESSPSSNPFSVLMSSRNCFAHEMEVVVSHRGFSCKAVCPDVFAQRLTPTLAGEGGHPSHSALPFFLPILSRVPLRQAQFQVFELTQFLLVTRSLPPAKSGMLPTA